MSRSVFIIDLASCTGCHACSVACKDRAGLPDEFDLLRVEAHEEGVYPNPALYYRVVHCFHCAQPLCAEACPTGAISKAEDGLTVIDTEECIGCGECIRACPFDAIVKCDGCADEVDRGWEPTCVRACPMRALKYESIDDIQFENRIPDPDTENQDMEPAVLYLLRK